MYLVCLTGNRLNLINVELKSDEMYKVWVKIIEATTLKLEEKYEFKMNNPRAYNRLLVLKQYYGELYGIRDLLSKTSAWSLLVIFTDIIIDFTSNPY